MAFETYNIVDNTTGKILSQVGIDLDNDPNGVINNTPSGTTAYLGTSDDKSETHYYVAGIKTARPAFSMVGFWNTTSITANGTSAATFSGLPNPTTIIVMVPYIKGLNQPGPITETSGSFTLTTTVAGQYKVIFDAFPYLQQVTTITAT